MARASLQRQLRCQDCCQHGVSLSEWCGWCEDNMTGHGEYDFDPEVEDDRDWLCLHSLYGGSSSS